MSKVEHAKIEAAVERQFEMPEHIAKLVSKLRADLYNGPLYEMPDGEPACFGEHGARQFDFQGAAQIVNDWLEDNVLECYYDRQSEECSTHSPEAWLDEETDEMIEPCWDDYYVIDFADVRRYLLGAELAQTI